MLPFNKPISPFAMLMAMAAGQAAARLDYAVHRTQEASLLVIVTGAFEFGDDLSAFREIVAQDHPVVVGFDSPGGNVAKAMEFGRLVRSLWLSTLQVRNAGCASAFSLAFLGGVHRLAQPGSIVVHKSSFSDIEGMHVDDAVSGSSRLRPKSSVTCQTWVE